MTRRGWIASLLAVLASLPFWKKVRATPPPKKRKIWIGHHWPK